MRACTALFAALAALAATAAVGQELSLPTTSRAERQLNENNRSLQIQQQQRRIEQQSQFDVNQLRTEIQREQTFPAPGSLRICAPGQIGC